MSKRMCCRRDWLKWLVANTNHSHNPSANRSTRSCNRWCSLATLFTSKRRIFSTTPCASCTRQSTIIWLWSLMRSAACTSRTRRRSWCQSSPSCTSSGTPYSSGCQRKVWAKRIEESLYLNLSMQASAWAMTRGSWWNSCDLAYCRDLEFKPAFLEQVSCRRSDRWDLKCPTQALRRTLARWKMMMSSCLKQHRKRAISLLNLWKTVCQRRSSVLI